MTSVIGIQTAFNVSRKRFMGYKQVPLIAAVNGYAIGAGNDLACMCDLHIAGQSARFASSFAKVGIIPGDGAA